MGSAIFDDAVLRNSASLMCIDSASTLPTRVIVSTPFPRSILLRAVSRAPRLLTSFALLAALLMSMAAYAGQENQKTGQEGGDATTKQDDGGKGDAEPQPEEKDLLAGKLDETWQHVSSEQGTKREDVWKVVEVEEVVDNKKVKGRVLVCLGNPKGYLRTKTKYKDFVLKFECRYTSDVNGNSGVLVYASSDKEKVWPDCMQIQLHRPEAGSIFPIGEAKSKYRVDAKADLGELKSWARCEIRSQDGKLTVTINGELVGEVPGCIPNSGHIALQSEGSEIHFRRVKLQDLTSSPTPTKTADTEPE